jgi:uncharacterized protein (TIGR02147 family)
MKSGTQVQSSSGLHREASAGFPARPDGLHSDFRLYLQSELVRRCQKNPKFSLRSFARLLQMDYSTLSKILRGQRPVGQRAMRKIAAKLGLGPEQIARFSGQAAVEVTETLSQAEYQRLSLDSFQIISDWYHYAILELMRVEGFKPDPRWIARALGISVAEVQAAVERLERVGIIEIARDGRWLDRSDGNTTTVGNEFTATAFRNLQKQVLERALEALEAVPYELRDQSSMTMAIDSRKLPAARQKIKAFRRELDQFLSRGGKRDQVYNLSVSLYPLTLLKQNLGVEK